MSSPVCRAVLTGEVIDGFSREAVISGLARLFEISAAEVLRAMDAAPCSVNGDLDAGEASRLQRKIERLGARVLVEPASEVDSRVPAMLHLPQQHDPAEAGLMRCPACGHQQLVAASCDECGVRFSEFNRLARESAMARSAEPRPAAKRHEAPPASVARPAPSRATPQRKPAPAAPVPHLTARDVHGEAQAGWCDDWMDDDNVPTEEYHLRLFMGMHSHPLSDYCVKASLGRRTRFRLTWTWGAVVSPFLWAMYRKMWLLGMFILGAEVLLPVLLISWGSHEGVSEKFTYLGFAVIVANRLFWPAIMRYLYCRHTRRSVMYMHRMAPTFAPDIDIATRGGTSRTSVLLGAVLAIVAALLTWSITGTVHDAFKRQTPVFVPPLATPQQRKTVESDPQTRILVNENKWVGTRNRLRSLGQRANVWFSKAGSEQNPALIDTDQLAAELGLSAEDLLDGWGNPIKFSSDGRGYKFNSAGPDGTFGNSDDVAYRRSLVR